MRLKKSLTSITVLLFFLLILGFSPSSSIAKEKFEEKFEKTVALAKDGKVYLKNISGDVEVKTWDRGEVKIDALKVSKHSSMDKAKEYAGLVKIEVTEEDGTLNIVVNYPKNGPNKMSVSVDFNLMIPSMATADINSVSGDLILQNIGGAAKAETVSGDVTLEKIAGTLKGKTVSGTVTATGAAKGAYCKSVSGNVMVDDVTGDAELYTVSGTIKAGSVRGSITAENTSGDVELIDVTDAKAIKAKTLSGDVDYTGVIFSDGTYEFKSHSGDVTLAIPSDAAFDLEARTFSGSINSEFEITLTGKISKKELKGSVNGGGATLEVKTFSGDVELKRK
jgi:predicted membrane protein